MTPVEVALVAARNAMQEGVYVKIGGVKRHLAGAATLESCVTAAVEALEKQGWLPPSSKSE